MTTTSKPGQELVGGSKNDEVGTPDPLYEELDRAFKFDYDPASSWLNHRCRLYSTKEGTFDAGLGHSMVTDQDGLIFSWKDRRVFVNPPYSSPLFGMYVDKMIAERNEAEIIVGLVKWDTSTAACKRLEEHALVIPLRRVKYKGKTAHATFASAIVVMKKDWGGYAR